jgi:geranylgeranyl reductase family protein
MDKYDVIIVGCGPAGATAGYLLGGFGFKSVLIDKSIFPRRKLCGGVLTRKTLKLLERVFDETALSLIRKNIINYISNSYDIFFRENLLAHGTSPFPFYFVDRYSYDYYLLKKAKKLGVTVLEGEKVKGIDLDSNVVSTSTGRKLEARFIIGADGAQSVVRKNFPDTHFNKIKWEYNLATALEIFIPRSDVQKSISHPIIHFGYIDWGYSWIFPNKDEIIIGLGGLNRMNNKRFIELFHEYLSALDLFPEMKKTQRIKINGHLIPCGNAVQKPVYHNAILVGDAAGFPDPISGEGIYQAQRSAEIASLSIYRSMNAGASLEKTYLKLLQEYIFPEIFHAKILRWFVFNSLNKLNLNNISWLTRHGEKCAIDIIHGLRSYKFLQRIDGIHGDRA